MGYFSDRALNVTLGDVREDREMDRMDGTMAQPRYASHEEAAAAQVEADASDDRQLIEKLIHLQGAFESFLTMTR